MSSGRSRRAGILISTTLKAVIEILPEPSAVDLGPEVLVRRGDDPGVGLHRFSPPTFMKSRVSMTRRSLDWRLDDTIADFVQKQRSLAGDLKFPFGFGHRVGEGPLTCPKSSLSRSVSWMAEQLMTMKGSSRQGLL